VGMSEHWAPGAGCTHLQLYLQGSEAFSLHQHHMPAYCCAFAHLRRPASLCIPGKLFVGTLTLGLLRQGGGAAPASYPL
jgi:hypothetical protein